MKERIFGIKGKKLDAMELLGILEEAESRTKWAVREIPEKKNTFEKAYNILMDYFDDLPEDLKVEADKRLKEVGL